MWLQNEKYVFQTTDITELRNERKPNKMKNDTRRDMTHWSTEEE